MKTKLAKENKGGKNNIADLQSLGAKIQTEIQISIIGQP